MKTSNHYSPHRLKRSGPERRSQLLAAFDRSGLSAAAFARQQKINYTTFCGWRQRRARNKASPAFVEVEVASAEPASELLIELGAHARMHISSAGQLALAARLLHHLNSAKPC